jgi:putative membrane protein
MNASELAALEQRVHAIRRPEPALLVLYVLQSMVLLCAAPVLLVPFYFHYYTLWYRFDAAGVSMGHGILFRKELQLTYARMQDIHLSQNILERWLGIGTVTIQTAGSGASGNLTIVGVKDYDAIRDYLYARMRGVHEEPHEERADGQGTDRLLTEIRDALVDAAEALKAGLR